MTVVDSRERAATCEPTPRLRPPPAQDSQAAMPAAISTHDSPSGPDTPTGQRSTEAHTCAAGEGQAGQPARDQMALAIQGPRVAGLADPSIYLAATLLDDLEALREATNNRIGAMTRTGADKDGHERGWGLTDDHPNVIVAKAMAEKLKALEHEAELALNRQMRRHPLGPWVKAANGVGERQAARLLAAIGDPYWNTLHNRPRTVSELWAYCGLKPGQKRQKGQRANWSTEAKMRAWNIAVACLKAKATSPYGKLYDQRRAVTADRIHAAPCVRCGPSGKPAETGSPWSAAHQHADALRVVSKAILRDLWRAAKDIHGPPQ